MMRREDVIRIVVLILVSFQSEAQNVGYERLTIADGLSQGMIFDIEQTDDGFLWFATKDGLNRYDGYHFEVFTYDPFNPFSIAGNEVTSLFKDSQGNLWMTLAGKGLDVLEKSSGKFLHLETIPGVGVRLTAHSITETADHSIWVGTTEGLIKIRWNTSPPFNLEVADLSSYATVEVVSQGPNPDKQVFYQIAANPDGTITLTLFEDGTYNFTPEDGSYEKVLPVHGFLIQDDANDVTWVIGLNQLYVIKKGQVREIEDVETRPYYIVISDEGEFIWASNEQGVIRFYSLPVDQVLRTNSLANPKLVCEAQDGQYYTIAKIDRSGNLWMGTSGYGLQKLKLHPQPFEHFLEGNSVSQVFFTDAVYLGLGGISPEFGKLDEQTNSLKPMRDLPLQVTQYFNSRDQTSYLLADDKYQDYLLIKKDDLSDKKNFDFYTDRHSPIAEDQAGNIWVGLQSAILIGIQSTSKKMAFLDLSNQFEKDGFVTALHVDSFQNLWVGTVNGVAKLDLAKHPSGENDFNTQTFWSQTEPLILDSSTPIIRNDPNDVTSLRYNWVSSFCEDPEAPDKYLWVSTKGGGMSRLDKLTGKFLHFTSKNSGLPNDVVYGILPDNNGNFWLSTNRGLSRMKVDGFVFQNYRASDGLQSDEFNTGAFVRCPDGRLLFGGVNGLTAFYPSMIHDRKSNASVNITGLKINNLLVNYLDKDSPIDHPINQIDHLVLDHTQNLVTLEFALMDFTTPEENRYRYRLLGIDQDWVDAGTSHSANYTNLTPGDYDFDVQGSIGSDHWSETNSILITVLPPWWATWLAYLLYFLLLCGIAFGVFILLKKRLLLQNQLKIEHEEAKRLKELDSFKSRLFTNLTHEFRTPLTVILGMSQQLRKGTKGKESIATGLQLIENNGRNLLRLINQLLDLSKLENNAFQMKLRQGDVIPYLRYVTESFQTFANSKNLSLRFFNENESLVMDFDSEQLKQILTNLISNAVKFTPSGGEVRVKLSTAADFLLLEVSDTGIGMRANDLQHIFDRFYQVDSSYTRAGEGTGIGLAHTQELVKSMNGTISVKSEFGQGSQFLVRLPIHKNAATFDAQSATELFEQTPIHNMFEANVSDQSTSVVQNASFPQLLIIEDNADVVVYLKSCLESEYQLDVAYNGKIGIEKALEQIPDLIISDVMMPEKDGYQVCDVLKNDERTSHIPILLLTAKADKLSKMTGIRRGADAFLSKPFNLEELQVQLRTLFENRRRMAAHFFMNIQSGRTIDLEHSELVEELKIEDAFIRKVKDIIEANYVDEDFGLPQLCQKIGMSRSQLFRKMKALTDIAPSVLIRSIRLEEARKLLLEGGLNVSEVAYKVGFKDPSYFSKLFQEEFGTLPSTTSK